MPPKKDPESGLPKKYVPKSLSKEDRKKQIKSIKEEKPRPKVESFKSKRSSNVVKFEKKYKTKISEAYDFFGGSSKAFMQLYKKCRINPFDFAFLNVDSLEMRRNFNDEIVYSRKEEFEKLKPKDEKIEIDESVE